MGINKKLAVKKKTTKKISRMSKRKPIVKSKKMVSSKKAISIKKVTTKKKIVPKKRVSSNKKIIKTKVAKLKLKTISEKLPNINNPTAVKKYLQKNYFYNHHHKKTPRCIFLKSLFSGNGFYKFVWLPVLILLFVLITDFLIEFVVYSNVAPVYVDIAKNTLFFSSIVFISFLLSIFAYFYMGLEGARNNFRFNKIFKIIVKVTVVVFLTELILIVLAYMTFLKPYLLTVLKDVNLQKLYLLYLIIWAFIKSVIYLIISSLAYLITYKLKFIHY